MPPQKLYPAYGEEISWLLGTGYVHRRPELSAIVSKCLTAWPYVEIKMAVLLSVLLSAETDAVIAVYHSLRMGRAQNDALEAAAKTVLDDQGTELFAAVTDIHNSVEKWRTKLAHGCLGYSNAIEDGIIWVDSKHHSRWNVWMLHKDVKYKHEDWRELGKHIYVYKKADLEDIHEQIVELEHIIFEFIGYVGWRPDRISLAHLSREERYSQLCAIPRVATQLKQIRKVQKSNP